MGVRAFAVSRPGKRRVAATSHRRRGKQSGPDPCFKFPSIQTCRDRRQSWMLHAACIVGDSMP